MSPMLRADRIEESITLNSFDLTAESIDEDISNRVFLHLKSRFRFKHTPNQLIWDLDEQFYQNHITICTEMI